MAMNKKMFSSVVSLFCSLSISAVVNYMVVFVFSPPVVYNILPMLPVAFLRAKDLGKKCSKPWQYAHFAVMLIISFLLYDMHRKIWTRESLFSEILMTSGLLLWCVLCVEGKISLRKKDMGYLILFVVICVLYFVLVWNHYNQRAAAAIDYIVENDQPETIAAGEIDALCQEIDRVLLGGDNDYRFWDLADRYRRRSGSYEEEYRELQKTVKNPDRNKIHVLMNAISSPRE